MAAAHKRIPLMVTRCFVFLAGLLFRMGLLLLAFFSCGKAGIGIERE
jgi:hypothetical protein